MPLPPPSGSADYGSRTGLGPRASTLPSVGSNSNLATAARRAQPPPIDTKADHRDGLRSAPASTPDEPRAGPSYEKKDAVGRRRDDWHANGLAYEKKREGRDADWADGQPAGHSSHGHSPTYRQSPTLPSATSAGALSSAGARDGADSRQGAVTYALAEAGGSSSDLANRPPVTPSGSRQPCAKCGQVMTGQFVRALGMVYHLDCFRCQDCNKVVASKFFPVDGVDGKQYPLCEKDYFKRLGLICAKCGGALRGSYITALDMKFHVEHFTCSVCPTVFGPQDSYYEHEGQVYCHFHYSTRFAVKCTGCRTAILKQFVEINRNNLDEHWHPECYMIHKFWNIKLAAAPATRKSSPEPIEPSMPGDLASTPVTKTGTPPTAEADDWQYQETIETPQSLKDRQKLMEEQVYRIWTVLSTFEESSAACISEMLRHVSNGQYLEGVRMAEKFVLHVETLFAAIDDLGALFRAKNAKEISHVREARMLCKKIVNFFSLLSHTHETGARKMNVTQELLSLVTGLAHYLKILIRIALASTLKLDREYGDRSGIGQFLGRLDRLARDPEASKASAPKTGNGSAPASKPRAYGYKSLTRAVGTLVGQGEATTDLCEGCRLTVEEECVRFGTSLRWHVTCLQCVNCNSVPARERGAKSVEEDKPTKPLRGFRIDMQSGREGGSGRAKGFRVYCGECASQAAQDGFEFVTRLEQYAFLLCVALNKLYGLLKQRGVLSPPADETRADVQSDDSRSLYDAYRNSTDIKRMKSVDLDRKLSTTARIPQRSTIIESPAGRVAQSSDAASRSQQNVDGNGRAQTKPPSKEAQRPPDRPRPPREAPPAFARPSEQPAPLRPAYPLPNDSFRPTLSRETTAVKIVNDQPTEGPRPQDGPRLGDQHGPLRDDGITLADLPRAMEAEQFKEQQRPLPTQAAMVGELSALEAVIMKHVAALTLANSPIKDETTLDELLEIVEARKGNFWGKLFKGGNEKPKVKKKGVFGVPLDVLIERHGVDSLLGAGAGQLRVPTFLDDCISAMKQMDMSIEGVFRKNGNIRRLKELADGIDRDDGSVNLSDDNPVQLAALLKKFLRDLPDPLLTFKLHHLFIATQRVDDEAGRLRALHLVTCLLPKAHRDSVEVLFVFLKWVASFSHVDEETGSKMDLQNLATVITPNILYARSKDPSRDESFLAIRAVHELLEHQDEIFQVPVEITAIMQDNELLSANPTELNSKDILKRVEVLLKQNANRPPPTILRQPAEHYRGRGEIHPHRPDVHSSTQDGRGEQRPTSQYPMSPNGLPPGSPRGASQMPPPSGSYGTPSNGSPREAFAQLPPQSRPYADPRHGGSRASLDQR